MMKMSFKIVENTQSSSPGMARNSWRRALGLVFALAAASASGSDRSTDQWPGFRGNGTSYVADQSLPLRWSETDNVAWQVELDGYGQSSPVVWDGRLYVTSILGANKETLSVEALSLETGERVWMKRFDASETREISKTQSRAAPTPVVDARAVYVFFESGDLFALGHDSEVIWHRRLVSEFGAFVGGHGVGSSLAQTTNAVFVSIQHGGPSYLLSVEKDTGKTRFKVDRPAKTAWTTPIVSRRQGRDEIIVSANGTVEAFDSQTGESLWSVSGVAKNWIASPSVTEEMVVVGASEKQGCIAIARDGSGDVTSTHVLWTADASADFASPLVTESCVYFINQAGGLTCVEGTTGKAVWKHRLPSAAWASPILVGERVYAFTKSGVSVVFEDNATEFVELATNELPVPSEDDAVYGIAVADSSIVVRTASKVFCIRASTATKSF